MYKNTFLTELGDTDIEYEVSIKDYDYFEAESENLGLTVMFHTFDNEDNEDDNETLRKSKRFEFDELVIEFMVDGRTDVTGKGNAFKVFATVKNILEKYLPLYAKHCASITYTAAEASRVKLYKKLLPIIGNILDQSGDNWVYNIDASGKKGKTGFTWKRVIMEQVQGELFPKKKYYVMINGKIWKKKGVPVEFDSFKSADNAARTIIYTYGKAAQVIDPDRYPVR